MSENGGGEVESPAPAPTEIHIEEYPEFCIPVVECPPCKLSYIQSSSNYI